MTGGAVAQGLSVRTVSERPWVRAPVEPQLFTCYNSKQLLDNKQSLF